MRLLLAFALTILAGASASASTLTCTEMFTFRSIELSSEGTAKFKGFKDVAEDAVFACEDAGGGTLPFFRNARAVCTLDDRHFNVQLTQVGLVTSMQLLHDTGLWLANLTYCVYND